MKRFVFIILILLPVVAFAQAPIQVSSPYQYNKYVKVLDSLVSKNVIIPRVAAFPTPKQTGQIVNKQDTVCFWNGSAWIRIRKVTWPEDSVRYASKSGVAADTAKLHNQIITKLAISDTTKLHNQIITKQPQLSGTGFVKASGTTITYDNSTYQPAGSYVLTSDTARYISKSQARKDIEDSIAPLRVDVRLLQNNPAGIWGNITGTLSNQTDLQNALNAKVSFPGFGSSHTTAAYGDHLHMGVYQPVGSYLTGNQTITLSGDVTGSGTTAITATLPNIATAGTYKSVTVNAKGQVTEGTSPTTLAGYGITDALAKNTTTVANPDSVFVVVDGNAQRAAVTSIPYGYYTNVNASGTGYNLTNTSALIDFSLTDPAVTITQSGTWKIQAGVYINYVSATVVAQTATFKLRRTNNTAADIVTSPTLNLTPCTTTTGYGAFIQLPPFWYSTSNSNDIIQLWGNISASLSAGNIQVVGAWITAEKIVD